MGKKYYSKSFKKILSNIDNIEDIEAQSHFEQEYPLINFSNFLLSFSIQIRKPMIKWILKKR